MIWTHQSSIVDSNVLRLLLRRMDGAIIGHSGNSLADPGSGAAAPPLSRSHRCSWPVPTPPHCSTELQSTSPVLVVHPLTRAPCFVAPKIPRPVLGPPYCVLAQVLPTPTQKLEAASSQGERPTISASQRLSKISTRLEQLVHSNWLRFNHDSTNEWTILPPTSISGSKPKDQGREIISRYLDRLPLLLPEWRAVHPS